MMLALLQLLQIVGEAAGRVSAEMRGNHPEIPWRQIVALRNRLLHGYDTIDSEILWHVLRDDVPLLCEALDVILASS